jgi:hypothetical protein
MGKWPVHQVQIQVFGLQILQSLVQARWHEFRSMESVPQLGCNKQLAAINAEFLECLPDL